MLNLLNKLIIRQREREQSAGDRYQQLIQRIAAGDKPDVADVEAILQDAGKTSDDLTAAIDLINRRNRWREIVAGEPELKRRFAELEKRREALKTAFVQAKSDYDQAIRSIGAEFREVEHGLRECAGANSELLRTAPAELRDEQGSLPTKAIYNQLETAERELRSARAHLAGLEREKDMGIGDANIDAKIKYLKSDVAAKTERVERLTAELQQLKNRRDQLAQETLAA